MAREWLADFISPPDEFSPAPFWFWNDTLEKDELKRQITAFYEKGIRAFVIHPRMGLPKEMPYLSDVFFEMVRYAAETAENLKMKVILYDEAMYPSGNAHGLIVEQNPELASKCIAQVSSCAANRPLLYCENGIGYAVEFSGGTMRGIHFGEDDGEDGAPRTADILNPAAVDKFIALTYQAYFERLKPYFGTTVIGIFTDEPSLLGRNHKKNVLPYSDGIWDEYIAEGGTAADLPVLFSKEKSQTQQYRKYMRIIRRRLAEVYYKKLSDWCTNHNVFLMGHPEQSMEIGVQSLFGIPGQDLVLRYVEPGSGSALQGEHSTMAKCSADAARHFGKRRNSNECFGACCKHGIPWNFTADDMKWYLDWLGVRGVNLFIPHAFYYSVRGMRAMERPPDVGMHNIWWAEFGKLITYMKRLSWLLTDSVNQSRWAVLSSDDRLEWKQTAHFYQAQVEFNYLPLSAIELCQLDNGMLLIHKQKYSAVFVPDWLQLPEEWQNLLLKFKEQGGKVETGTPDVKQNDFKTQSACPDLRVTHLVKGENHFYFVTNEGEEEVCCIASLPPNAWVEQWSVWEGVLCNEFEASYIPLHLGRRESTLLAWIPYAKAEFKHWTFEGTAVLAPRLLKESEMAEGMTSVRYQAAVELNQVPQRAVLSVGKGGEIIRASVNGMQIGASMWPPHQFEIHSALKPGENRIELEAVASLAWKYSGVWTDFGVEDVELVMRGYG